MACPTSASHPYAKAVHANYQPIIASKILVGRDLCIDVAVAFSLQNGTRGLGPPCANSNSGHVLPAIEFLDTARC